VHPGAATYPVLLQRDALPKVVVVDVETVVLGRADAMEVQRDAQQARMFPADQQVPRDESVPPQVRLEPAQQAAWPQVLPQSAQ
jgi:hypothetical protein